MVLIALLTKSHDPPSKGSGVSWGAFGWCRLGIRAYAKGLGFT